MILAPQWQSGTVWKRQNRNERNMKRNRPERKQKRDARIKAEAQEVINAGKREAEKPIPDTKPDIKSDVRQPRMETVENPVNIIDFRVYVTTGQAAALKHFLKTNGIRFEPVPKQ